MVTWAVNLIITVMQKKKKKDCAIWMHFTQQFKDQIDSVNHITSSLFPAMH